MFANTYLPEPSQDDGWAIFHSRDGRLKGQVAAFFEHGFDFAIDFSRDGTKAVDPKVLAKVQKAFNDVRLLEDIRWVSEAAWDDLMESD